MNDWVRQAICVPSRGASGIENGLVEILFGGEVAEDDGFGDAGGGGDFLGGGAAEAFAGEKIDGDVDELAAAVVGGHAGLVRFGGTGMIVSKYLLICKSEVG